MPTPEQAAFISLLKNEAEQARMFQQQGMERAGRSLWRDAREFFPLHLAEEGPREYDQNLGYEVEIPPYVGGFVEYEGTERACTVTLDTGFPTKPIRPPHEQITIAIADVDEELSLMKTHGDFLLTSITREGRFLRTPTRHDMKKYITAMSTFSPYPQDELPALPE